MSPEASPSGSDDVSPASHEVIAEVRGVKDGELIGEVRVHQSTPPVEFFLRPEFQDHGRDWRKFVANLIRRLNTRIKATGCLEDFYNHPVSLKSRQAVIDSVGEMVRRFSGGMAEVVPVLNQ